MAKTQSLFYDYVERYLPKFDNLIEKINDKRKNTLTYWYKDHLRQEFSDDGKWTSGSVNTTYVAADMVDIDSPLPVKMRDKMSSSNGDLPLVGMKFKLLASQIKTLQNMVRRGIIGTQLQQKLMNDKVRCAMGIQEAMEKAYLEGLSGGYSVLRDETHKGLGMRLNFKYFDENQYMPNSPWADVVGSHDKLTGLTQLEGATPVSDLIRVLDEHPDISYIIMAKEAMDIVRKSDESKILVANSNNVTYKDPDDLSTPLTSAFEDAFKKEHGVDFLIDKRIVRVETPDGKRHKTRPWDITKVIFLTSLQTGALVYTDLAEDSPEHQVAGVQYQKPFPYALMSIWGHNDPLEEWTGIQAPAAPIIENVDEIYRMDITSGNVVDVTAEAADTDDSKTTVFGTAYAKTAIVTALKQFGISTTTAAKDTKIIQYINGLTVEQQNQLKTLLNGGTVDMHDVNDTKEDETTTDPDPE